MHEKNVHREGYDYDKLVALLPELGDKLIKNPKGRVTIDFSDSESVYLLNKSLLMGHYGITYWEIPEGYLCPSVPGRADYIHHLYDILSLDSKVKPQGRKLVCMDIGTGANCIYPIIGNKSYRWSYIGTEVDKEALASAKKIVKSNPHLSKAISIRHQARPNQILKGIWNADEYIDVIMCNPPFYRDEAEANKATERKNKNLKLNTSGETKRNFSGRHHELLFPGGEQAFIKTMIKESKNVGKQCHTFTCLVSNKKHLPKIQESINKQGVTAQQVTNLSIGNKTSSILSWTYLTPKQRKIWSQSRWS